MTLSWTQIFGLFQLTIRDPKEGAEAVLTLPLPRGAVPIIFILSVVFVALLSGVLQLVLPIPEEANAVSSRGGEAGNTKENYLKCRYAPRYSNFTFVIS